MITEDAAPNADPRRWATLGIVLTSVLIAALDATVLNVAIPTILEEFDTTLTALQWVITGYTLTFAALLIIGGRLSDIFGPRRMFVIGAALFGIGSFIASISSGVPELVLGEAVIEGMGASLMLPATMGILSTTFTGRERGMAFGAWGGTMGAAAAFGPLLGGFLTTNYSWRWAFRINVIVVPFAIVGALLFMRKVATSGRRERIDVPGSLLIATGMLLLVFSISEGAEYGWFRPTQDLVVGGTVLWPAGAPVSIVVVTAVVAVALLVGFVALERWKERRDRDPLFEFSQLRILTFRYGLSTLVLMAMGQISFLFVLSVFLQEGLRLSAVETGLWLVPSGLFIIVGSQVGARLTRRIDTTFVVRSGLLLEATGLGVVAWAVDPSASFLHLLPGLALFGIGVGFAASQLTNVVLSGISPERSGAASGANTTVRMIGSSLGIAVISTLLTTFTQRATSSDPATVAAAGARPALVFGTVVVAVGTVVSLLIPRLGSPDDVDDDLRRVEQESEAIAETYAVQ
ncbi:MFS transporter [Dermatobacter hominis]|uniref:MFS transporter n=1 Tax=Dermatobacter hominis TaxID=2884263 RepID=UPI001D125F49|nr:MFS transporter [Dermatobacter hominis]UDY35666.1 MFS transporter [Dermatobacter hominis]